MANNYVQLSEIYNLNDKQVEWVKEFFVDCDEVEFADPDTEEGAKFLERMHNLLGSSGDSIECYAIEAKSCIDLDPEKKTLWIYGDEYINTDMVFAVLQAMLAETDSEEVLTGTWAETFSEPRVGEFGGGWFAVSAQECKTGNSWDAAEQAAKKMRG
jgi:hypothetical protein